MAARGSIAVLVAVLVVLAGCSAATDLGGGAATPTAEPAASDGGADGDSTDSVTGPAGSVNFYLSDRPGAMDDFEHLNVTVTTVKFKLADGTAESATNDTATAVEENATGGNATAADDANANARTAVGADENATMTTTTAATTTAQPAEAEGGDDETAAEEEGSDDEADEAAAADEGDGDEGESEEGEEQAEAAEGESEDEADDGDGRWVTREINATTVDLTRLRGANATLVDQFDLPAGEYEQVRLVVSETNGTLKSGDSPTVKLPSQTLKLHKSFTIGDGSDIDFVYDVSVHKAGKNGKYILKPVVAESGTDVPIERVDEKKNTSKQGKNNTNGDDDSSLSVQFVGRVTAGENATLEVRKQNDPVENATVTVNGENVGATGADGRLTFSVPADAETVEVEVVSGDDEGELERELHGDDGEDGGDSGQGNGTGQSDGQENGNGQNDG